MYVIACTRAMALIFYRALTITVQGGVINEVDSLETPLNALPEKYDILRESYFAQTPAPEIE